MKNLPRILTLLFLAGISLSACGKKETSGCGSLICQNNATCIGGTCACPSGFEGTFCEYRDRDKFLAADGNPAIYIYQDNLESGTCSNFYGELTIARHPADSGKVIVSGFAGFGPEASIVARIFNSHISAELQQVAGEPLYNFNLQGEFTDNRITGTYQLSKQAFNGEFGKNCTLSFTWGKR